MPIDLETYSNDRLSPKIRPSDARQQAIRLGANLTLAKGTVLGKKTSDGKFYPYDDDNSDGTETAKCLLIQACVTDASGNAYLSDSAVASSINTPFRTVQVYESGTFDPAELTGLDNAAILDLNASLDAAGLLRIPN